MVNFKELFAQKKIAQTSTNANEYNKNSLMNVMSFYYLHANKSARYEWFSIERRHTNYCIYHCVPVTPLDQSRPAPTRLRHLGRSIIYLFSYLNHEIISNYRKVGHLTFSSRFHSVLAHIPLQYRLIQTSICEQFLKYRLIWKIL